MRTRSLTVSSRIRIIVNDITNFYFQILPRLCMEVVVRPKVKVLNVINYKKNTKMGCEFRKIII